MRSSSSALLVDRIFFHSSSSPAGIGSGVAATQARSLPPFTRVEPTGDNNVIVQGGARQSVIVHADSSVTGLNSRNLTVALPGRQHPRDWNHDQISATFIVRGGPPGVDHVLRGDRPPELRGLLRGTTREQLDVHSR